MSRAEHRRPDETRAGRCRPRAAQSRPCRRVLQLGETELHMAVALRDHVLRDRDGGDLGSAVRYRAVRGHLPLVHTYMRRTTLERHDLPEVTPRSPPAVRA